MSDVNGTNPGSNKAVHVGHVKVGDKVLSIFFDLTGSLAFTLINMLQNMSPAKANTYFEQGKLTN